MRDMLIENPLLILALVAALGYAIGHIKIAGSSLGVAAVLFVGLAFGAFDPRFKLPESFYLLGLATFVYTIGLSSGPTFFLALRSRGLRDNIFGISLLLLGAAVLFGLYHIFQLPATIVGGIFAGSFTNTPALASVLDYIRSVSSDAARETQLSEAVVGYSATYPIGVIGPMLAMLLVRWLWRIDYGAEVEQLRKAGIVNEHLQQRTIRITQPDAFQQSIAKLVRAHQMKVLFSRIRQGKQTHLVTGQTILGNGDVVLAIGAQDELERVTKLLGEPTNERIDTDRSQLDYRRMFVSNPEVTGQPLRNLHLMENYGATVTRVRRGDTDILASGDTVLALGDRVRVLAEAGQMERLKTFFGDSYRAISEVNILSLSLGLTIGLLLGLIPIPLPGGITLKLGYAGGPLVAGIVLGARERIGPLIWTLPYSANLTLRQIGLILFLAGIGTSAGSALLDAFAQGNGWLIIAFGAISTSIVSLFGLWVGHKLLRIPLSLLLGMFAGIQTHPALLSFATEQTQNDVPTIGYTTVYPVAIIAKIVIAQLLIASLWPV